MHEVIVASAPCIRAYFRPISTPCVLQAAETGSGKTGAFALPALQIVHETLRAVAAAAASAAAEGPADGSSVTKRPRVEDAPARLSTTDRTPMLAIAPDGLTCQSRQEHDWAGVRATRGAARGKVYFEAEIRDEGLCRFGWSSASASLDLGTDRGGFGYGGTGKRSNNRAFEPYGEPFAKGDVIGCSLELSDAGGSVSFSKNGKLLGSAFSLPAAAARGGALFPAICMKNAECAVNFGGSGGTSFKHLPVGYVGLDDVAGVRASGAIVVAAGAPSTANRVGRGSASAATAAGAPAPVCLVLEPARDLAEQTAKAFESLAKYVSAPAISHALIIGGVDQREVTRALSNGADIVTATPGKLMDLLEGGKLSLAAVRLLVLDEADRFADAESLAMIAKLHAHVRRAVEVADSVAASVASAGGAAAPPRARLQVAFFSATLHSPEIGKLAGMLTVNPTWVDLKGKDSVPETVHHVVVRVDPSAERAWASGAVGVTTGVATDGVHARDRISDAPGARALTADEASEGLKRLKPAMLLSLVESLSMEQALIFCRTNVDCDNLEAFLVARGGGSAFRGGREKGKENPYSCVVLAGMRSMDERRRNLEAFKAGDVRFLICTDVAARGLDIKELPYVINMTLPDETENYIHRIGRVGRADRMGLAISLVAAPGVREKVWYHKCANRGKGCSNTRTADVGGCCIWSDEDKALAAIRTRLQLPAGEGIPEMVPLRDAAPRAGAVPLPFAFNLPASVASLGAVYGQERGGVSEASAHVESLRGQVASLAALEVRAQKAFLALQQRYAGGRVSAVTT